MFYFEALDDATVHHPLHHCAIVIFHAVAYLPEVAFESRKRRRNGTANLDETRFIK